MIRFNEDQVKNLEKAWNYIREGKIKCEYDGCDRKATDLHNHKSNNPDDWKALCAICHAEIEENACAWTPLGMLAVRYADVVRAKNQLTNKVDARKRLEWEGIEADLSLPIVQLEAKKDELKKILEGQAKKHEMWDYWLKDVTGIGELSGALLIAVMERAWEAKVRSIRDQRRYFGLAPNGVFENKAENQKYHTTCKWLISQALANSVMMQKGTFGDRYKYHRGKVDNEHPDWSKGHQYNATWIRVARDFMKTLFIVWAKNRNHEVGQRHPEDTSPSSEAWIR